MKLTRVRITVRGIMAVVAVVAVAMAAPEFELDRRENALFVKVIGTSALAMEKSRREVERSRRGGDTVGRFHFLGRFFWNLPVAILIVVLCIMFNETINWPLRNMIYWLQASVFSTGHSLYATLQETFEVRWQIHNALIAGIDLGVALAALLLWDAAGRRAKLHATSVPPSTPLPVSHSTQTSGDER